MLWVTSLSFIKTQTNGGIDEQPKRRRGMDDRQLATLKKPDLVSVDSYHHDLYLVLHNHDVSLVMDREICISYGENQIKLESEQNFIYF
jgi:hypothetical protein